MKTFIVSYQTNYGLGVAIINAPTIEIAKEYADKSDYIWQPYLIISVDELPKTEGILQILS